MLGLPRTAAGSASWESSAPGLRGTSDVTGSDSSARTRVRGADQVSVLAWRLSHAVTLCFCTSTWIKQGRTLGQSSWNLFPQPKGQRRRSIAGHLLMHFTGGKAETTNCLGVWVLLFG